MSDLPIEENNFVHRTPSWVIRRGNLMIFLILTSALILSLIIKYNDALASEILLTSQNPPVHIISKKKARVTEVNVLAGEKVRTDQVLLILENNSNSNDVFSLKNLLLDSTQLIQNINSLSQTYPSSLKLETTIQLSYQKFISKYSQLILYNVLDDNKSETQNINSRLRTTRSVVKNKQLQLNALFNSLKLSQNSLIRQRTLFSKGVISKQQLDGFEQQYLRLQAEYQNFKQELNQLYVDSLSLKNLGVKTNNLDLVNATMFLSELLLAKQELISKIDEWEDRNILKSPIDGYVTIFDIWNKNQMVELGEKVLTVIPANQSDFIGICKVPIQNSGKIKINQRVIIKIDNYPSREWGNLTGTVRSISEVPKKGRESYYSVYVKIPSLKTSYGKEIEFKQEMFGSAKIILEETSLLNRVFYGFRELWSDVRA